LAEEAQPVTKRALVLTVPNPFLKEPFCLRNSVTAGRTTCQIRILTFLNCLV
jgi:hypothetical protein